MSITHTYHPESAYRIHRIVGHFTLNQIFDELKLIYQNPHFGSCPHSIWDLRDAHSDGFNFLNVSSLTRFVESQSHSQVDYKSALVASRLIELEHSEMFRSLVEQSTKINLKVFRNLDLAIKWVTGGAT